MASVIIGETAAPFNSRTTNFERCWTVHYSLRARVCLQLTSLPSPPSASSPSSSSSYSLSFFAVSSSSVSASSVSSSPVSSSSALDAKKNSK